jgi:hypothetical protein
MDEGVDVGIIHPIDCGAADGDGDGCRGAVSAVEVEGEACADTALEGDGIT